MKLLSKILTATLPLSLVGILTPTIVSCSCNKKGLSLNYKDTINCMFKDKEHYHKHGDIVNAIKPHLIKEDRKKIEQTFLDQINSE
ncbi:MAG: hypothetical protein MJ219_03470 [Mycoplasmoidaceae bacterium]|nr:hypothetical protein [Mycoplasmoidaceae bacterium]